MEQKWLVLLSVAVAGQWVTIVYFGVAGFCISIQAGVCDQSMDYFGLHDIFVDLQRAWRTEPLAWLYSNLMSAYINKKTFLALDLKSFLAKSKANQTLMTVGESSYAINLCHVGQKISFRVSASQVRHDLSLCCRI